MSYRTPGGGTRSIHDWGSDGASYCKPKKIHKPEIWDPKKYLTSKFPTQKNTHVAEKKSSNQYFSDPLIATKTRNEKFARRYDPKTEKNSRILLRPKQIREWSRACKFSTHKNTSDPPSRHTFFEWPPDTGQNSQTVERRKRETKPLSSEHGGGQEPMGRDKPAK